MIRTENANKERLLSREASGDISKNRGVRDVGANKVAQITLSTQKPAGVSRYDAKSGRAASVQYPPSDTIVESGAAIANNTEFMYDATGRAIAAVGAGNYVAGRTNNESSATAAGQELSCMLYSEPARILP